MNYEEIETFLAIIENGSIAKAAKELFIEQGSVSKRIASLESKLNIQLFYRQKGVRKITLTRQGEQFLPIAQQVYSLLNDAINIQYQPNYQKIKIASTNSLNYLFLHDFYKKFMIDHPDIEIYSQTEHSKESYQLIENQLMDIALTNSLHNYPNVIATPIFEEDYVFLYHKNSKFAKSKKIQDLQDIHEVYQTWSHDFNIWHQNYFPYFHKKKITLGNLTSTTAFLDSIDTWTILTRKMAKIWTDQHPDWKYCAIPNPPATRIAYILYHKYPKPGTSQIIKLFIQDFNKFIVNDRYIKIKEI